MNTNKLGWKPEAGDTADAKHRACFDAVHKRSSAFVRGVAPLLSLAWIVVSFGCGSSNESSNPGGATDSRPRIVATTAMVADIARNVGGDFAQVRAIIGEGVDPHLYRPSRADVSALLDADVALYNGLNLEGKMSETFEQLRSSGRTAVAVAESIDASYLLAPPEFEGHYDPHVWMDPNGWKRATEIVLQTLTTKYPDEAETFRSNAARYMEQLDELDAYARKCLDSIPAERRVMITAHDAFNYFARAYDIEVLGIQGISTESEAGLMRIREMVDVIVERKIPAIFTETSVSDKNIRALIEGARSRGHEVKIGGELFSDAMGAAGTYEGTYIGMIDHNVTIITRALGGVAPERGMNGRLR